MPDDTPHDWESQRFPYYKRWSKDFLSSGRLLAMSHLQRSIYSVLLDRSWVEDGLPTDRSELAMLALCTPDELAEAWTWPLDSAFVEIDGRLRSPRMEDERQDAMRLRGARSRGGRKSPQDSSKTLPSDLQDSSSDPEVTPSISQSQSQSQQSQSRAEQREGHAPQAEQTRRPKRANRQSNMLEACKRLDAPDWLAEALGVYMRARKDARFKVWSVELWEDEAKQVLALGEDAARTLCLRASKKPWSRIVFEDSIGSNAQQAGSQAPSAGRWYKGPPLKDVEARQRRMEIHDRYRAEAGDFMLTEEEAMERARADGDRAMHEYDWMTGRRDDRPPVNGERVVDVTQRGGS